MSAPRTIKYILALVLIASGCYGPPSPVFMSDKDFVEWDRQYSPDGSKLILNYSVDTGAFGYGNGGTAVLKTTDLDKNLKDFDLPRDLMQVKWVDDKTISAGVDIIPNIRSGKKPEIRDMQINGINVRVSPVDFIQETSYLKIEHRETSPNGQFELVAYRYYYESDMSFIHISVIKKGEPLPKYGNYFIADRSSDRILGGTWTQANTLAFLHQQQICRRSPIFLC